MLHAGTPQPHHVECIAVTNPRFIWVACRDTVKAFSRGQEVGCFRGHRGNVHILLPFGEHLISIDDRNCLKIWAVKAKGESLQLQLSHIQNIRHLLCTKIMKALFTAFLYSFPIELYGELHFDPKSFPVTCAMHPSTYLNKILLASRSGTMQLWNVHTSKLIYSFAGWGSAVLAVVQSPAVDVVGVGLENGGVVLHNLRYDETLMKFQQEWGPVLTLSFRTGEWTPVGWPLLTHSVCVCRWY